MFLQLLKIITIKNLHRHNYKKPCNAVKSFHMALDLEIEPREWDEEEIEDATEM